MNYSGSGVRGAPHWFHRTKLAPHYDLIEVERAAALAAGAEYVPAMEQARRRRAARATV